jgi:hypothetical protein
MNRIVACVIVAIVLVAALYLLMRPASGWTLVNLKEWRTLCRRRGHLRFGHGDR